VFFPHIIGKRSQRASASLDFGENIDKIANIGSKKAGVSSDIFGKLHDFKENFHWEEAFLWESVIIG
jgi:hypothetical protein